MNSLHKDTTMNFYSYDDVLNISASAIKYIKPDLHSASLFDTFSSMLLAPRIDMWSH